LVGIPFRQGTYCIRGEEETPKKKEVRDIFFAEEREEEEEERELKMTTKARIKRNSKEILGMQSARLIKPLRTAEVAEHLEKERNLT